MHRATAVGLALLVVAATGPVAAAAGPSAAPSTESTAQSEVYAGTHVSFEASGNAVTDYSVGGDVLFENVSVAPKSETDAGADVGVDAGLSAVSDLVGVDVSLEARTETRAEVGTEGSASLTAHDTDRGILTVHAGEDEQYVEIDLAGEGDASTESDGDQRVVVDTANRTGAFVVAGDGEVAVNDEGDVTADLGSDSTLVFRAYEDGERDESDREQERLIAEGTATAEVYAEERDGERVADAATYGQDLAVEAQSESEQRLNMTVDRAESEGTVLIASGSEAVLGAVESADDVAVTVDGEAAAEASSYSELEGGIGEEPRYMVSQSSEASASADVLVAVDHFSERDVAIRQSDSGSGADGSGDGEADGSDGDGSDDGSNGDGTPGFGVGITLVALLTAVALRTRD